MGFYEMLIEHQKNKCLFFSGLQDHFTSGLFADLLDSSVNPDVRICSSLKMSLFELQLVYVTDKDRIGYYEIKEEQKTDVFYSVTRKNQRLLYAASTKIYGFLAQAQFKTVGFRSNAPASPTRQMTESLS